MGSFKKSIGDGINDVSEDSKELSETGNDMVSKAEKINGILDSIEVADEDDKSAAEKAKSGYSSSFDKAHEEQIESVGEELEQQGDQIKSEAEGELKNVEAGVKSFESAAGVSEIGREAAEGGKASLEKSAGEYEGFISEIGGVVSETMDEVNKIRNALKSIW